jgi:hypothetical protein
MKYIVVLVIFVNILVAKSFTEPTHTYKVSSGLVSDLVANENRLYVATDTGCVNIFNLATESKEEDFTLEKIKDFMGDEVDSKIYSVDVIDGKLLLLSQDSGGYSRLHIYQNKKLFRVISKEDKLNIIKAKFIDNNNIVIALISNDIISYNIKTKKENWVHQASMSKFSSFALNNERNVVAIADESGDVHLLSTKDGSTIKILSGANVDNIFSIDYKGSIILTGGQDRRAGVYNLLTQSSYYKNSTFFVYGVGLSPSGKIAAYSSDMKNNITLFYTATQENIGKYASDGMIVNSIYFINEKEFFINSSSNSVRYFKLK